MDASEEPFTRGSSLHVAYVIGEMSSSQLSCLWVTGFICRAGVTWRDGGGGGGGGTNLFSS